MTTHSTRVNRGLAPPGSRWLVIRDLSGEEPGESLDSTVLALLRDAVGREVRRTRLRRYVTWTPADLDEFTAALRSQRVVDR